MSVCAMPLAAQVPTDKGTGATLRTLDKVSGTVEDIGVANGASVELGRISITLGECRYPPSNIQGEAYAWVTVLEEGELIFSGWMVASSPALNAVDHPRYDVWVLRCSSS
ncbi:DUF2155 domain-containing protein [Roseobacteraceae bacterium S113]